MNEIHMYNTPLDAGQFKNRTKFKRKLANSNRHYQRIMYSKLVIRRDITNNI